MNFLISFLKVSFFYVKPNFCTEGWEYEGFSWMMLTCCGFKLPEALASPLNFTTICKQVVSLAIIFFTFYWNENSISQA